jgi:hypothetical protein
MNVFGPAAQNAPPENGGAQGNGSKCSQNLNRRLARHLHVATHAVLN